MTSKPLSVGVQAGGAEPRGLVAPDQKGDKVAVRRGPPALTLAERRAREDVWGAFVVSVASIHSLRVPRNNLSDESRWAPRALTSEASCAVSSPGRENWAGAQPRLQTACNLWGRPGPVLLAITYPQGH